MAPLAPALPFIAMAASIGGTVYAATQQAKAGKQEKVATETQVSRLGEEEKVSVEQEQDKQRRLLSAARARVGASGVEMEGSPLLAMMESQVQGEKDIANIRKDYNWQVQDTIYSGQQRQKAANTGAGTSLLTGFSNAAENAYKYWGA